MHKQPTGHHPSSVHLIGKSCPGSHHSATWSPGDRSGSTDLATEALGSLSTEQAGTAGHQKPAAIHTGEGKPERAQGASRAGLRVELPADTLSTRHRAAMMPQQGLGHLSRCMGVGGKGAAHRAVYLCLYPQPPPQAPPPGVLEGQLEGSGPREGRAGRQAGSEADARCQPRATHLAVFLGMALLLQCCRNRLRNLQQGPKSDVGLTARCSPQASTNSTGGPGLCESVCCQWHPLTPHPTWQMGTARALSRCRLSDPGSAWHSSWQVMGTAACGQWAHTQLQSQGRGSHT